MGRGREERVIESLKSLLEERFGVSASACDVTLDRGAPFMEGGREVKLDVLRFQFHEAIFDKTGESMPTKIVQDALVDGLSKVWPHKKRPLIDAALKHEHLPSSMALEARKAAEEVQEAKIFTPVTQQPERKLAFAMH